MAAVTRHTDSLSLSPDIRKSGATGSLIQDVRSHPKRERECSSLHLSLPILHFGVNLGQARTYRLIDRSNRGNPPNSDAFIQLRRLRETRGAAHATSWKRIGLFRRGPRIWVMCLNKTAGKDEGRRRTRTTELSIFLRPRMSHKCGQAYKTLLGSSKLG